MQRTSTAVEIVIPDKLKVMAARLEKYAYRYRMEAKEKSKGKKELEAKTQVCFSNVRQGLVLALRKTKEDKWEFHEYKNLPKLNDENEPMDGIVQGDDE